MECPGTANPSHCTCTFIGCDKRGNCCKCVAFHRTRNEIPGCFFTSDGERSFDRSLTNFIADRSPVYR